MPIRQVIRVPTVGEFLAVVDLDCDASVAALDVVYSDGGIVKPALATTIALSGAIGICTEKASATVCTVVFAGRIEGLFAGLNDAKDYFLSAATAGAMTITPPTGIGRIILRIGRPIGTTDFVVQIGSRLQRAI